VELAAIAVVVVPASRTRWRPVELTPLRRPRALGQLLRAARRIYTRHWRVLIALGLTSLLIVVSFEGLRPLGEALLGEGSLDLVSSSNSGQGLSGSIVGIGSQVALAVVSGAIVTFMLELERGRTLGVVESYRELGPRFWRAVLVHLLVRLFIALLFLTVIGIPYAIKKFVDWQFAQQEVIFEDRSLREALHGSRRAVRGHWWHALVGIGVLFLLSVVAGPVLGFALVFTALSPAAINLFGSLVYALVLPYVPVGLTLLYLDLRARQEAG
jgi:ABC-type dipeptide/oligopeptide/nickel transport system permease subunit